MAITAKQFLEEARVIIEDTAIECFGSVEAFITAYNAGVDAEQSADADAVAYGEAQ